MVGLLKFHAHILLVVVGGVSFFSCVSLGGRVDPSELVGRETVLDVAPWCRLTMDHAGPGLYRLRVFCSPRYSMDDRAPEPGDLCDDPPFAHPVLSLLCDPDNRGMEAFVVLTARQWDDLVEALADRGLAGER